MKFTHEVEIARDREAVWKAFANPDNMKAWQPSLQSREQISGSPGVPGAVARLTFLEGGQTIVLTETVTGCRPPEEMTGTYEAAQMRNTLVMRFDEAGPGRTRMSCEADFEFRGAMRLMAPMLSGMLRQRTAENFERFKTKVEAGEI